MKNLNVIAEDLFNKIRGRFPSVTIGNEQGEVTNIPKEARFFDFDYKEGDTSLGKISISLDEDAISVMYSDNIVANEDSFTKNKWYGFLKELRVFAKKRMLTFDTRNITKSNLNKRDYKFLSANRSGDVDMNESKLYGTSKTSYQDVDSARLAIRHTKPVNPELPTGRTQHIDSIYVESSEGERFKYPFKHLNGARAMARHVAEGGKPFDEFGQHITGLSEELSKLRKFKNYMNRSSVMAESLSGYVDVVKERIDTVKNTVSKLQKTSYYQEAFENFEQPVFEEVPDDVKENWIDELTIKQFNEELSDVFPYIYKLIGEATRAKELGPEELLGERELPMDIDGASAGPNPIHIVRKGDTVYSLAKAYGVSVEDVIKANKLDADAGIKPGDKLVMPDAYKESYELALTNSFDEMMGQFAEGRADAPKGDRVTTDENPLIVSYDDEYKPGRPALAGHSNLKTWMRIHAIGEKYQEQLAQAVLDAGQGEKVSVPDEAKADYDDERAKENLKPRALWIELSQHHEKEKESDATAEGNKFSGELEKARKQGKDEMEVDGKKIPVTEFVLSFFDRETGQFPRGETAVLTKVEKEYGDQFITPAKQFIEAINNKMAEMYGYRDNELEEGPITAKIASTDTAKKIAKDFDKRPTKGLSMQNIMKKAQDLFGPDDKDDKTKEGTDLNRIKGLAGL